MNKEIQEYNAKLSENNQEICNFLMHEINKALPDAESKVWHAHPVWFLEGNPIVGYSKVKDFIRLMFWSGADFNDEDLKQGTGKFKDASIQYTDKKQIDEKQVQSWLEKGRTIQWDYKNIVKRKGKLERLF